MSGPTYEPTYSNCVVRKDKAKALEFGKGEKKIVQPDTHLVEPLTATLIAAGPECDESLTPGLRLIINHFAGVFPDPEDDRLMIIEEREIRAIINTTEIPDAP